MIADSSFHALTQRRGRVEGCPGLWWRRRADGSIVYEIKLRQPGVLGSDTLPEGTSETSGKNGMEEGEREARRGRQAALAERHARSSCRRSVR